MAKVKIEKDNSERWLLTYADLMNLLLILFILLYSMANIDVAKYQQVAASLRQAFGDTSVAQVIGSNGGAPSMVSIDTTAPSPVVPSELEDQQMQDIQDTVENLIKDQGLKGEVSVTLQERGIVISIGEQVLFKSGSADIEPESKNAIVQIGKDILSKIPGKQIRVEGHTDNIPIKNSRYPDNQELSTARANSVLRVLRDEAGLDPTKMSSAGYGEYRPKVPNDTDEHRRENRRVDITILRDVFDTSEPSAAANAGVTGTAVNNAASAEAGTAN